jgi:protein O-GlcNAc transferase
VPEPDAEAPDLKFQQAVALHQQGRLADAEHLYLEISRQTPDHADVWHLLGIIAVQNERPEQAAELIGKAIALHEPVAAAHNNRGIALRKLHRLESALADFDRAIELEPDHAEAHNNRGITLMDLARPGPALESIERALALRPDYAEALNNRGILLRKAGRFDAALASFDSAIASRPDHAGAQCNRGNVLLDLWRAGEALASFDRALALEPDRAETYTGRGNALFKLDRFADALASYDQAIALRPDYSEAHGDRGNALRQLGRPEDALASYDRAIELKPDDAGPWYNRGELLRLEGRTGDAVASLEAGVGVDPLYGICRLAACMAELPILYQSEAEIPMRRRRYMAALARLDAATRDRAVRLSLAREIGAPPFYLPYQGEDDIVPQTIHGRLASRLLAEAEPAVRLPARPLPGERIRLGIVSGFFRTQTVFKLFLEGWLTEIDRDRFEVIGFHTGRIEDETTARATALCDRFVRGVPSGPAWRKAISDTAPHVLLYPEVGMDAVVGWLAAQRLAPVQCVAWGHPVTTGLPTIDYFLTSDFMEPPEGQEHYTERLVRMPRLGAHYTPDEGAPAEIDHAAAGLDPAVPIYWSGQSLFKYSPRYDWVFPRIAAAVGPCQFVFVSTLSRSLTMMFRDRIGRAFAAAGLDADRYRVILPSMPHERYIGVAGLADVILDPLGWSGGKSTLDCLTDNPAIVTMPGRFMRSRHTAAILRQIGCEETIAATPDAYVAIAARLGMDVTWRTLVRQKVADRKHLAFRDRAYIRALETFLAEALTRS